MKNQDSWIFISVLPNLILINSFETKYAAIVSYDDERVKYIRENNKSIDELLESFIDTELRKIKPSVLLIHKRIYSKIERHAAIVAFRNVIALSVILDGWIPIIFSKHLNIYSTLYSDFYDLFPMNGYSDKFYFVNSPALSNIISNAKIKFQSNYALPDTNNFYLFFDDKLINALFNILEKYFIKKNKVHSYSSLFRSLQVVFSACKMPTDNISTFYDYGIKVGLWISAFEILFHPGGVGKIGYKDIIKELNKYELLNPKIKNKLYSINNNIKTNIIGLVYNEIYNARNDFYHGNNIDENRLYIFKKKKFPLITHIAPIIYLIALYVFLKDKNYLLNTTPKNSDEEIINYIKKERIEEVFIKIVSKKIVI